MTRSRTTCLPAAVCLFTVALLALPGAALATMVTDAPAPVAASPLPGCQDDADYQSYAGFVWADKRHGDWDIFRKKFNGSEWFEEWICTAAGDQTHPQAAEYFLVWQDHRNGDWDIYGWSLDGHTEFPICTAAGDQIRPRIERDRVVWQDGRSGNWNVWEATLSEPAGPVSSGPTQVTSGGANEIAPDVSGDNIVFQTDGDDNWDIYGAPFGDPMGAPFAICANAKRQDEPVVSGDTVVWRDFRSLAGNGTDLYGHTLSTHTTFPVVTAAGDQESPSLSADIVVYTDYRTAFQRNSATQGPDIGFYDLRLDEDGPVAIAKGAQNKPAIDGLTVAWSDWRSATTKSDIWTAQLTPWTASVAVAGRPRWVKSPIVDLELEASSKYGSVTQMTVANVGTTGPIGHLPYATALTGWDLDAVLADISDGPRTVRASFLDDSGGAFAQSPPVGWAVTLDTTVPITAAPYAERVERGARATLRYRVRDNLAPKATATIRIKTLGGKTVKTLRLGQVTTGRLLGRSFVCTLRKGIYRFYVTAKDLAGNESTLPGASDKLYVR